MSKPAVCCGAVCTEPFPLGIGGNRAVVVDSLKTRPKPERPVHTAGSDTIFVQIYMDPPTGVPGVSKNQNFFFTNKTVEFLR